ncbi:MAG: alpha-amylase [Planctomycetales bacterium]|nr:alpha-amylase [Planctomycetales bacterium]
MATPRYPSLYQINTRVWLTELSRTLGHRATLDDIPDASLDEFARQGFDWIWLLSVWQTGPFAQAISRKNAGWRHEFEQTLSDLTDDDIAGSGFAITSYSVHKDLGGDAALARLRARMQKRGLKLMLDFVPNHMAPDHPWVEQHPDYFIAGSEIDLARAPQNYFRVPTTNGSRLFAYGRDPYFDGWPDTIQLNYGNPDLQQAMIGELTRIAGQCDGVRCDMAMLVLPDVFERTWGIRAELFWPKATESVRKKHPQFQFMAEVYWDLEWTMQHQGFDYAYDKRLYDRLREHHARPVREHFHAGLDYQDKLSRFLENHDEPRAAATFSREVHEAAAVITFLSPGLRFFHQGQFEGRLKRISPHLVRAPAEDVDENLKQFYERLLAVLRHDAVRNGSWRQLECASAWDGNGSNDNFIACEWQGTDGQRLLAAVNYSPNQSQCYVRWPHDDLRQSKWLLKDRMGEAAYDRDGADLLSRGFYLDLPAWDYHVFHLEHR